MAHENNLIADNEYSEHQLKKDRANKEKRKDKDIPINCTKEGYVGPKTLVTTMDLQAVLPAPALQASALYYKQKLAVHNFVVYNLATHDIQCYLWHEGEGGLSSNEFSSCITDYLQQNVQYEEYVLYSYGCSYQNRNSIPPNTLSSFAQTHNKTVMQKYLERGHMQMEVNSAHTAIEQKLCPGPEKKCVNISHPS